VCGSFAISQSINALPCVPIIRGSAAAATSEIVMNTLLMLGALTPAEENRVGRSGYYSSVVHRPAGARRGCLFSRAPGGDRHQEVSVRGRYRRGVLVGAGRRGRLPGGTPWRRACHFLVLPLAVPDHEDSGDDRAARRDRPWVLAADGASIPFRKDSRPASSIATNFQDARQVPGERRRKEGRQLGIITAGTYRINRALFTVISSENAQETRDELRPTRAAARRAGYGRHRDDARRPSPIEAGEIAGPVIPGPRKTSRMHKHF